VKTLTFFLAILLLMAGPSQILASGTDSSGFTKLIDYKVEDPPSKKVVVGSDWTDLPRYMKTAAEFCKEKGFAYFETFTDNKEAAFIVGNKMEVQVICYDSPERAVLGAEMNMKDVSIKWLSILMYFSPLQKGDLITQVEDKPISSFVDLLISLREVDSKKETVKGLVRRGASTVPFDAPIIRLKTTKVEDMLTWLRDM
jgi:hypothetical protein